MALPIKIWSSSFTAIGNRNVTSDHSTCSQLFPHQAPHPHCSGASEATWSDGRSQGGLRKVVSFDSSTKHCHQARSARNPELKRIGAKLRSPGVFDYLVREVDQSCGEGMNSLSGLPPYMHGLVHRPGIPAPYDCRPFGPPTASAVCHLGGAALPRWCPL